MKKLLFFAVSAILAGASYCTSVGEKIVAKVTNRTAARTDVGAGTVLCRVQSTR